MRDAVPGHASADRPVAVVTGAYSGIGAATADWLASRGFRVLRAGLRSSHQSDNIALDLRIPSSIKEAIEEIRSRVDRVGALIHCAGMMLTGALEETSPREAKEQFDINFFGLTSLTQAMLEPMRNAGRGRIICVSSVAGFLPGPFIGFYAASKHALEAYCETLDYEVRDFGIRSVLIQPGLIRTGIVDKGRSTAIELEIYRTHRKRAVRRLRKQISQGSDPALVAQVIHRAIISSNPRRRYLVGKGAGLLWRIRKWGPDILVKLTVERMIR